MGHADGEARKVVVRRLQDAVWSRGDMAALDELLAPDFVCHLPGMPEWRGPAGVAEVVCSLRAAFPDWHERVDELVAEGDLVASRYTSTGTHLGTFWGIAPSGRRVTVAEMALFRFAGDRIAEQWNVTDLLGLLRQIGAREIPA